MIWHPTSEEDMAEEAQRLADAIDRDILNEFLPDSQKLPDLWHRLRNILSIEGEMEKHNNQLWHPDTDPPGTAENALIACNKWGSELYLVGIAEVRNGQWCSEEWGEPIKPPYWWANEADLIALIPKTEEPPPCQHLWEPPLFSHGEWHYGHAVCLRCHKQIFRTVESPSP